MKVLIAILLMGLLLSIAFVHIYWAMGGKKWMQAVVPSADGVTPLFKPRTIDSLAVGFAFIAFAYIIACEVKFLNHNSWFVQYGIWAMMGIFTIRTIGDFKYVGFFKKIRHTTFAINDTRFFSPLCLLLAFLTLILKMF